MRTIDELCQKIADDLVWRRRELSSIRMAIENADKDKQLQRSLIRAGVALLYAHWEGFVKKIGSQYLEYVANQGRKANELTPNFIAIKLKTYLLDAVKSKKISTTHEVVDFFCNSLNKKLRIPYKGIIDTQSNLSSTVLTEIMYTLGLDNKPYEIKKNLINESLVNRRNHIAHGENLDISVADYLNLHIEVMTLIDEFRDQVENAAATNRFLSKTAMRVSP